MSTAREILKKKGREVWSVSPDATVFDALGIMAEKEIGALMVIDEGSIIGILSERDYARKVILLGKASRDLAVREIMSDKVVFAPPQLTVDACMTLMTEMHIRHLPVMEGDRVTGVISIGDVVKAIIADREIMIDQLENYIRGG